jgi:predicted enzyme related to lactoylglutathione lyase
MTDRTTGKVTGIGGVFFKTTDKSKTLDWFRTHFGLAMEDWGTVFRWRERDDPDTKGNTALGVFAADSDYFDPSPHPFMLNFRVDDLDAITAHLRASGITVQEFPPAPNGRFAHLVGPDNVKIELWEPAVPDPYDP